MRQKQARVPPGKIFRNLLDNPPKSSQEIRQKPYGNLGSMRRSSATRLPGLHPPPSSRLHDGKGCSATQPASEALAEVLAEGACVERDDRLSEPGMPAIL